MSLIANIQRAVNDRYRTPRNPHRTNKTVICDGANQCQERITKDTLNSRGLLLIKDTCVDLKIFSSLPPATRKKIAAATPISKKTELNAVGNTGTGLSMLTTVTVQVFSEISAK